MTFVTSTAPDQWAMLKRFNAEFESEFGHAPPLNPQLQWKMYASDLTFLALNDVCTDQFVGNGCLLNQLKIREKANKKFKYSALGSRNKSCKQTKIAVRKQSWYSRGQKVYLIIATSTGRKCSPVVHGVFALTLCRRPSWNGEGWFFYAISVYAGSPEVIVPSMMRIFHEHRSTQD